MILLIVKKRKFAKRENGFKGIAISCIFLARRKVMKRNSILVLIIMLMISGCGKNVPVKEDITEDEESFVEWALTILSFT